VLIKDINLQWKLLIFERTICIFMLMLLIVFLH